MCITYSALLAFISKSLFCTSTQFQIMTFFFSFEILFCFQSDSGMILWTTSPPLPSMFYRINQPGEFSPCLINVQLALLFGMVRF